MDNLRKKAIELARKRSETSVDGVARPDDHEEKINALCRSLLTGPDGEALMEYVKSITTSTVLPPTATDNELRMREGMRQLCAILDTRRRSTPKP